MSLAATYAKNVAGANLDRNTSSLFDLSRKPQATGSSYVTLSCEPSHYGSLHTTRKSRTNLENSYRMEPTKKFVSDKIQPLIQTVLEEKLSHETYNAEKCAELSKSISQEIKLRIKALHYDRFKIVCTVSIGEKKNQDIMMGSRCVWDTDKDNYASGSYANASLFSIAVVYGLYYE